MRRLLLLLPLFALAGCKDPQDGVRVTVTYEQFVPGCIRVTALDDASGEKRSTDVAVRGTSAADGQVVVAVVLPEKWGTQLTVTADAFEAPLEGGACVSPAVRSHTKGITVQKGDAKKGTPQEVALAVNAPDEDGDGYVATGSGGTDCNDAAEAGAQVHPNAAELCNGQDENCDGTNDESFQIGDACTSPEGCVSVRSCNPDDVTKTSTICKAKELVYAWADEDKDGFGDVKQEQLAVCSLTLPPNRLPTSAQRTDCDDSNAAVKPGATEVCNDIDDNCTDGKDEGFNVGVGCNDPASNCLGANACNVALGTPYCKPNAGSPSLYPDEDADTFGRTDGGVIFCGSKTGYVASAGDCNDGNRFTHEGAPELCDGQDNNCNTMTDESACAAGTTPKWVASTVTMNDGGVALRSVSPDQNGNVWVAGEDSTRAFKLTGGTGFTNIPVRCTGAGGAGTRALYSVWLNPNEDKAYIGGENDILKIQTSTSQDCGATKPPEAKDTTTGLIGFVENNQLQILGVSSLANGDSGGTFLWDGTATAATVRSYNGTPLFDVHGTSLALTFAVGGKGTNPTILRHVPGSAEWEEAQASIPGGRVLNAVKVVHDKLAYAVGNTGTLLKWNGTEWKLESGPGSTENFTGVLSFGANSIYITTDLGKIYQYDGATWTIVSTGSGLYDIEGSNPGDIWAVGNFGRVSHFTSSP